MGRRRLLFSTRRIIWVGGLGAPNGRSPTKPWGSGVSEEARKYLRVYRRLPEDQQINYLLLVPETAPRNIGGSYHGPGSGLVPIRSCMRENTSGD